ncbi:MAG: DUF3450 family protein [Deltaproteobacteria bacterium]|nr:DUF3450 family protein [Deltaproteobacteria bacterium]
MTRRGFREHHLKGAFRVEWLAAILISIAFVSTAGGTPAGAAKSRAMAQQLATLRTEINDIDASLRSRRNLATTELRGLQMRVNEIALDEDAEKIRVQTLEAELAALQESIANKDEQSASLREAVLEAIAKLQKGVKNCLPFKMKQRLDALTQIGRDLKSGNTDAAAAATRVWRFVQDEQRLASTVEPADESIVLSGDSPPTLVRVVRVGTVAMFVYAGSNRWGRVVRGSDDTFEYSDIADREQQREIRRLFESVEKQILEGRYRLPLFQAGGSQ